MKFRSLRWWNWLLICAGIFAGLLAVLMTYRIAREIIQHPESLYDYAWITAASAIAIFLAVNQSCATYVEKNVSRVFGVGLVVVMAGIAGLVCVIVLAAKNVAAPIVALRASLFLLSFGLFLFVLPLQIMLRK